MKPALSVMFAFSRGSLHRTTSRINTKHLAFSLTSVATVGAAVNMTLLDDGKEDQEGELAAKENKKEFNVKGRDGKEFWHTEKGKSFLKEIISDSQESKTLADSIKNQGVSIKQKVVGAAVPIIDKAKSLFSAKKSKTKGEEEQGLFGLVGSFSSLAKGGEDRQDALDSLMSNARDAAGTGGIQDTAGFSELLALMQETSGKIQEVLVDHFEHIDFSYFTPTALWYYLEYEDERKNPSWRCLQHRFHKSIDVRMVEDLNDALFLSDLSYVDTPQELKDGLKKANIPLELVYYSMESEPGKPSHFVAVKKGQSWWSNSLEVYIVARGTKTIADAATDLILEACDYRDGKAHAGIVDSGKWLAEKHQDLLDELLKISNKSKLKLTLIGHSLGAGKSFFCVIPMFLLSWLLVHSAQTSLRFECLTAGAAVVAGMELNDKEGMDVEVIGFGCPALLSKELSESTADYVTTVICDSDVIPRMSGATVANLALDIMEYDRYPKLHRDAKLAVDALAERYPKIVSEERKKIVLDYIEETKDDLRKRLLKPKTEERMDVVLFPPGKCVHFYRDGHSISGSISPCDFFSEIDVTRTMVDDHLVPTGYGKIFLDLMRVYHDDKDFQFQNKSDNEGEEAKEE